MIKLLKRSVVWGFTIATTFFTFVPDSLIGTVKLYKKMTDDQSLLINRIIILIAVFIASLLLNILYNWMRRKIKIRGKDYCIQVEFGDLFKSKGCQRIISFDECFTTSVGNAPHEIKPASICGQYLKAHPNLDIQRIIDETGLRPDEEKSRFNNQNKYTSGLVVPAGDDLLMAFAKLDTNGRAFFPTRDDYLEALTVMWTEIHKYYQMKDVCIPILGSGLTTIGESSPSHQELLDCIIESYKLSAPKIKNPQKLRIICQRRDGISLNRIGEMI